MSSSGKQHVAREQEAFLRGDPRRWYWIPGSVLALGLASFIMLVGTRVYEAGIQRDQARAHAIEEIRLALANSHLWLEEYLTGDDVDLDEVGANLSRARELIDSLLGDRERSPIAPLSDDPARDVARRMREQVEAFGELSDRRLRGYVRGEPVGVGSELDVEYDGAFRELLEDASRLGAALNQREAENRQRGRVLFRAILAAWFLIVALAVGGLWTRERRRARAEAALRESQAQLLQAQKLDAIGRLAGGVAHDINNYLGAIRAQSELVRMRSSPSDGVAQSMDAIVRVVTKASSLIERLLAFSRHEPIRPEVVDLNRVVAEGVGPMVRRLVGEDVRLNTHLEPELWSVKIDPSEIEQVIVNLVVNAREAMPTGGAITIATSNRKLGQTAARAAGLARAGEYVALWVSDTGPGIPESIRERIFEPYFTTKPPGTSGGLGLSTVYGIVQQNGGAVTVESEPGRGAGFEVLLPRSRESPKSDEPAGIEVAGRGELSGTVLLVEDNDELRESTRAMVETLGCEVIAASSGAEALEMYGDVAEDVDLVITDVVMPGMNGRELIDRLRPKSERMKVLYVSGYTDDVVFRHGIASGEAAFLKKPFSASALCSKIRELLGTSTR